MGLVPKCIKEETKMDFGLSLYRLMGLLITFMLSVTLAEQYVHSWFNFPFIVTCIIYYLILNLPAPNNPKRSLWQGLFLWLIRLFTPISYMSIIGYAYAEAQQGKEEMKFEAK